MEKLKYIRGDRRQFGGKIYYISGWVSVKRAIVKNPKFHQRVIPGYDSTGKVKGYLVYRRKK